MFDVEKYHGKNGPLTVEDRVWRSNLPQAFIDAGLELGFNQLDINGENQTGSILFGFCIIQVVISKIK